MSLLDNAKDLAKLVQQLDNVEITQKVIDLQREALEMQEELFRVKEELRKARDTGETDSKLVMRHGVFYLEDDSIHESRRGPFCTQCWANKQRLVPLEIIEERHACFDCHTCNSRFGSIPISTRGGGFH